MNNIIKQILVQLAIDGKLPLDMNNLDENIFSVIPNDVLLAELKQRKYIPEDAFTILDVDNFDENDELSLEQKYFILNDVMSNGQLMAEINYDLECGVKNILDINVSDDDSENSNGFTLSLDSDFNIN